MRKSRCHSLESGPVHISRIQTPKLSFKQVQKATVKSDQKELHSAMRTSKGLFHLFSDVRSVR